MKLKPVDGWLTIFTSQDEVEHTLETKDAQEIPADTGHPPGIHLLGHNASLQHALELDGDGEGQFDNDKAAEKGVDPAHDEGVGDHHGHVILHHAHHAVHGVGVRHGVGGGLAATIRVLQEGTRLVCAGEVLAPRTEGRGRQDVEVISRGHTTDHGTLLPDGFLVESLRLRDHQDRGVVS